MLADVPEITVFMHGASNYPLHKEVSDVDVPLPDGTDDDVYLSLLNGHLDRLLNPADPLPDLVLYQCGVDVLATDIGKAASPWRDAWNETVSCLTVVLDWAYLWFAPWEVDTLPTSTRSSKHTSTPCAALDAWIRH